MRTDWEAHYLDGRTAARTPVRVRLSQVGFQFAPEGGAASWWAYSEVRLQPGFQAGDPVRLERGGEFPEILLIRDPAFLSTLRQFAPDLSARHRDASRRLGWGTVSLIILGAILACALIAHFWVIPALASFLAPRIPISWEEQLAGSSREALAPAGKRCDDSARMAPIEAIVVKLARVIPEGGHHFHVFVVNEPVVNAVAGPGGIIVIYQGLLDRTDSPEALAGVLAHEMQHVARRHIMRIFLEHASSSVLIAAATGEGGEALTFGLQNAMMLGFLRYSREHEAEADMAGFRMMEGAGIDPRGMIGFFELLQKEESDAPPGMLTYLSTHPGTNSRIASLRSHLPPGGTAFEPLLPGIDWKRARAVCAGALAAGAAGVVPAS
ncbi:MAG: M48 family metallopeptidase [Deltaproteobacteria bacterium]|nr:M48 family metallopeptidase [Deltaproteobacteria bacterium]